MIQKPNTACIISHGQAATIELLANDLDHAAATHPGGLFCKEIDELVDLLTVTKALVELAHSEDVRSYLREWYEYAYSRMNELQS